MPNRGRRGNRRGFIELRTVVALVVVLTILPIAISIITILSNFKVNYDFINDEISLFQLRRIMLISYDIDNSVNQLNFLYHGDEYSLSLINNRLVLQPGYQVFLDHVDYVEFSEEDGALSITYERNGNENKTYIYKEKGIYIDDFSDINDEQFDLDDYDE